ncbi:hypothetical protein NL317_31750, partial [Klebsiella pneumoniae]|nr:hypothetical protein [Klebsiella pneumoniae]
LLVYAGFRGYGFGHKINLDELHTIWDFVCYGSYLFAFLIGHLLMACCVLVVIVLFVAYALEVYHFLATKYQLLKEAFCTP